MTPFIMTINFATPVSAGMLPTLDAILAAEIAQEHGDDAISDLPLAVTDGVWQASSLFAEVGGAAQAETRYRMIDKHYYNPPNDLKANRNWGNTEFTITTVPIRLGLYIGVGDVDAIDAIMSDVPAIGAFRAKGFGRIESYDIERLYDAPEYWGLADGIGQPARPVPTRVWAKLGLPELGLMSFTRARPFYWSEDTPRELCAVPVGRALEDLDLGDAA